MAIRWIKSKFSSNFSKNIYIIQVGSLTNHYQTQCFSTHLTTFAGGFLSLPNPINWNYLFSHANVSQNKTIYMSVICTCIIYIILVIYARAQDKKDWEKVE